LTALVLVAIVAFLWCISRPPKKKPMPQNIPTVTVGMDKDEWLEFALDLIEEKEWAAKRKRDRRGY
jgi:hypothetical protein